MFKQKQMISASGENLASAAAFIIDFIEDPAEREVELNKLRKLAIDHAKMEEDFDVKERTLKHVRAKLEVTHDLELNTVSLR